MAEHPRVFVSYSHDSPEHKQWVLELGTKLRHEGIDVILDQWALRPGADRTLFMERGVKESDRVVVICTDNYVRKANDREGGVGYEHMIVTAQLARDLGTDKFIPIIRQASEEEKTPTFLETRVYIDFTDERQFDKKFDELLRELHDAPTVEEPPLGEKPSFAKQEAPPPEGLDIQLPEIPEQVESADKAYEVAVEITRTEDEIGWRRLVKQIKPSAFNLLIQRRQEGMAGKLPKDKKPFQVVDEAVDIISPLISVALAGVESKKEQFRDQKSTLNDLLNIAGERDTGAAIWIDMPRALGYVYHSLHGSLSLSTDQLGLALNLARVKVPNLYKTKYQHVWETDYLIGWFGSFGPNCKDGWEYLSTAYKRHWAWLVPIFGDESEYRTSLVAYYMALNIHELASRIASGEQDTLESICNFMVPLTLFSEGYNITQRAVTLLHDQKELAKLWTCLNVTHKQMESSWENWIRSFKNWFGDRYETRRNSIAHQNIFKIYENFFEGL